MRTWVAIHLSAVALLLCCDAPVQTDSGAGGKCIGFNANDMVHYSISVPNGGEVFRLGDTVTIRFCSEDLSYYTLNDADKMYSIDNGRNWNPVAYETGTLDNEVRWVIPESTTVFDMETGDLYDVSTVSDSCRIRIGIYSGHPAYSEMDRDLSDQVFRIIPRI